MTVNQLRKALDECEDKFPNLDVGDIDLKFASGYHITYLELIFTITGGSSEFLPPPPRIELKGDK